MTNRELLTMHTKLFSQIELLTEALGILEDEPFASGEPDNEAFCLGMQMRIGKLLIMAQDFEKKLCPTEYTVL